MKTITLKNLSFSLCKIELPLAHFRQVTNECFSFLTSCIRVILSLNWTLFISLNLPESRCVRGTRCQLSGMNLEKSTT